MASGGGIKGFYRQRKKSATVAGGVAKPSAAAAASNKKGAAAVKVPSAAPVVGDAAQPPALILHGSLNLDDSEYGPEEEALRQFDMDMRYGPCLGMTRLERWERAARLGLHPPPELEGLLLRRRGEAGGGGAPIVNLECLWEGRI